MKLLFRQRFFSWLDSYDVYDEAGNTVYVVKGELAWGHCLKIFDGVTGRELGTVKERVLTFLPKFEIFQGDTYLGEIRKEFTFFKPRFDLDFNGWSVEGDFWEWDYRVQNRSGCQVASASKKIWNWTDTYEIDVARPEDALYALMIVLAIDAAKCSQND